MCLEAIYIYVLNSFIIYFSQMDIFRKIIEKSFLYFDYIQRNIITNFIWYLYIITKYWLFYFNADFNYIEIKKNLYDNSNNCAQ
jgi:hypothetical protein